MIKSNQKNMVNKILLIFINKIKIYKIIQLINNNIINLKKIKEK